MTRCDGLRVLKAAGLPPLAWTLTMATLDTDDGSNDSVAALDARALLYTRYALLLALAGALFTLVCGVIFGPIRGIEAVLIGVSAVGCTGMMWLSRQNGGLSSTWLPGMVSLYLATHLVAGALLGFAVSGDPTRAMSYLLWFFPLLCFHRFANTTGAMAQSVHLMLALVPPVLAAGMLPGVYAAGDSLHLVLLIDFALAFVAFVVLLDLFARYRKALDVVTTRESTVRHAAREIADREARYRTLVDLVPVMIRQEDWAAARDMIRKLMAEGITDLGTHFRDDPGSLARMTDLVVPQGVNRQGLDMWGAVDLADFRTRHGQCLQAPLVQALYSRALADFALGVQSLQAAEVSYVVAGRTYQTVLKVAVPDFGAPEAAVVVTEMDVTEVKRSGDLLSAFARATRDVIYNWNLQTDRQWWSAGLLRCFGHDPEDFMTRRLRWVDHIHPEDRAAVAQSWDAGLSGPADSWRADYRFACADGRFAHVRDTALLDRDADGRVVEIIGSIDDVTEEVTLQEKFLQSQKLEAIGRVAGGIAHDFNNLLTIVIGNAEMLEDRLAQDPGGRVLAERTMIAAERAAELTSHLLSFGRRQRLRPVPTDVAELLRRVESLAARTLGTRGILELRGGVGMPQVMVDPSQLESAILNICRNAGDAMPDGGTLTVTLAIATRADLTDDLAATGADYVKLSLADTGSGMDAQTCERAFEPFFTTKDSAKASGLGLSMVYGFARQSMGTVRMQSQPGVGSTVTLILPAAPAA